MYPAAWNVAWVLAGGHRERKKGGVLQNPSLHVPGKTKLAFPHVTHHEPPATTSGCPAWPDSNHWLAHPAADNAASLQSGDLRKRHGRRRELLGTAELHAWRGPGEKRPVHLIPTFLRAPEGARSPGAKSRPAPMAPGIVETPRQDEMRQFSSYT